MRFIQQHIQMTNDIREIYDSLEDCVYTRVCQKNFFFRFPTLKMSSAVSWKKCFDKKF